MNTIPVVVSTLNVEDLTKYPDSFIEFADGNNLKYPKLTTGNGQALCAMLLTSGHHWSRPECDEFVKKFNIATRDSIQLFNKHEQWGIKTSGERGKNYIVEPYTLSNKHKMRKNFQTFFCKWNKKISYSNSKKKSLKESPYFIYF